MKIQIEINITTSGNAANQWNEVKALCRIRAKEICSILNALSDAHQKACGETGPTRIEIANPTHGNGWDRYLWLPGYETLRGMNGVPELDALKWGRDLSWAKRLAEQLIAFQPELAFEEKANA